MVFQCTAQQQGNLALLVDCPGHCLVQSVDRQKRLDRAVSTA